MVGTIAAVATPRGVGGVAMVRISGAASKQIAEKIFDGKLTARHMAYGKFRENGAVIDDGCAVLFNAPASYTGERTVELYCHGGYFVTEKILELCLAAGARLAKPGEFTRRAVINGKLSLPEAESVGDIISAENEAFLRASASGRQGALIRRVEPVKSAVLSAEAALFASLDFPEETEDVDFSAYLPGLESAFAELKKLSETFFEGIRLRSGWPVVIAGKSNAGKSTIMNLLLNQSRSIVTNIPGTTRDAVSERVRLGSYDFLLEDTAGLRESNDEIEQIGIGITKDLLGEAALAIAVFDGSREFDDDDRELLRLLKIQKLPALYVINKSDLPGKLDVSAITDITASENLVNLVSVSALAENSENVRDILARALIDLREKAGTANDFESGFIANRRQYDEIIAAKEQLGLFLRQKDMSTADILYENLRAAHAALSRLTGEAASESVINAVFSSFCVGK